MTIASLTKENVVPMDFLLNAAESDAPSPTSTDVEVAPDTLHLLTERLEAEIEATAVIPDT